MSNLENLKNNMPIKDICDHLNYPYKKRGESYFCKCPVPSHQDRHDTNCHFKENWNKMYCEACGASISALDLIMYVEYCDLSTAIERLWEINGCPDWFKSPQSNKSVPTFYLTADQQKLLGINPYPNIQVPVKIDFYKPENNHYFIENDYYVETSSAFIDQHDFISSENFLIMARNKCVEKIMALKVMEKTNKNDLDFIQSIKNVIKEVYNLQLKIDRQIKRSTCC